MLRRDYPVLLKSDATFKELAKQYRGQQKDLQELKDYALELQKKNRVLMIENEKLRKISSH